MNTQTPTAATAPKFNFSRQVQNHPAKYDGTAFSALHVVKVANGLASTYTPSEESFINTAHAEELWNWAMENLDSVRQNIDDEQASLYAELVADAVYERLESLGIHSTLLEDLIDTAHSKFADDKYVFWNTETQDWNTTALFHEELSELVYENAE